MIQPPQQHSADRPPNQAIEIDRDLNLALLENSGIIHFSGTDAAEFLQGQLTNDVNLATQQQAQLTGYCNPKGRLIGLFQLLITEDSYLAITDREMVSALIQRLQMFVMRSAVTIENLSAEWAVVGLWGNDADKFLRDQGYAPTNDARKVSDSNTSPPMIVVRTGANQSAYLLIGRRDQITALLNNAPHAHVNEKAWQLLTIGAGHPSLTEATVDAFIPQMINLDLIDGISFQKGCYPGQEIVARTRYLGKLKRRMFLFDLPGCDVKPGDPIFTDANDQSVGTIVSTAVTADDQSRVLAVIRLVALQNPLKTAAGLKLSRVSLPYSVPTTTENSS